MRTLRRLVSLALVLSFTGLLLARPGGQARREAEPVVQLDPLGPLTSVSALAFSPDGRTLYAAGLDKVVYSWRLDASGKFQPAGATFRVPIGPGREGSLNALAVSTDGRWLAVGGKGLAQGTAGFREEGVIAPFPALSEPMRLDQGTIFLFDLRNGDMTRLRGHTGAVLALSFASGAPARLVSAAQEWDSTRNKLCGGLRLWDVEASRELAKLRLPSVSAFAAPGLTAWAKDDEPSRVRAAVAWEGDDNESLGIWDPSATRPWVPTTKDKTFGNSAVYAPELERVFTGSFANPIGELRSWKLGDAGGLATSKLVAKFPAEKNAGLIPRGLALFSSESGGGLDRAAVALTGTGAERRTKLAVVSLENKQGLPLRDLGPACNRPILASALGGRHLAVTLPPAPGIQVFSIATLLKPGGKARELPLGGVAIRYVAFVTSAERTALLLAADKAGTKGRRVFDVARRQFADDLDAWESAGPNEQGWSATMARLGPNHPGEIVVRRGAAEALRVQVPGATRLLHHAFLPPAKTHPWPLVAVSYLDEAGQPTLGLFIADDKKGSAIRQLSGHATGVLSLAFAGDKPLLASAADDNTACVWSLADLDKVIGKMGRLAGVAVSEEAGKVVVARGEIDSPHQDELPAGTVLEAIVERDKAKTLNSAAEFYRAVAQYAPGKSLQLRVRGPAEAAARTITVTIDQGIDERKPLFTFFQPEANEWVAWSPLGPYDSATRERGEKAFGWHFNPVEAGAKVRFEPASQESTRKRYRRQGILKNLVARANLAEALEDWKKENTPQASMILDVRPDDPEKPRLNQRIIAASLRDNFPLEDVHKIEWQFDKEPWQEFTSREDGDRTWTAAIPRNLWKRGEHSVRVRLFTTEQKNKPAWEDSLTVPFQPPPPRIEFPQEWVKEHFGDRIRPIVRKDKPKFPVRARIEPFEGQSVKVTLWHNKQPIPVGPNVEKDLELEPNQKNLIGIEAINVGAPDADLERTVEWLEVTYAKTFVPADFTIASVAGKPVRPGEMIVVEDAKVEIAGAIKAEETLDVGTRDGKPLVGFEPGSRRDFVFKETLDLKPGAREVVFAAKTKNTESVSIPVKVYYRPKLPELSFVKPDDGAAFVEGRDPAGVDLVAKLVKRDQQAPFQLELLVNGQVKTRPEVPAVVNALVKVPVSLDGGENRIGLRLSNEWGARLDKEITLLYRRPPRIVRVEAPHDGKKSFVQVIAEVRTAANRPLTSLRINDRVVEFDKPAEVNEQGALWRVTSPPVPLSFGDNSIRVQAFNADGEALERKEVKVNLPLPAKAEIALTPAADALAKSASFTLGVSVKSESPVTRLEVRRENVVVKSFDVTKLRPSADNLYLLEENIPLTLAPDVNSITVEADNAGGRQTAKVTVTYKQPPVSVVIDQLLELAGTDAKHKPEEKDGIWTVDRIKTGRVRIQGRVLWTDPKTEGLQKPARVRVFVNGFQQLPAELKVPAAGSAERTFESELWLSRAADNRIEIELPEIAVAGVGGRRTLPGLVGVVGACDEPIRGQRLHLLPIALDPAARPHLLDQALKALGAVKRGDHWTAPAFEEVVDYSLGNAEVTPGRLFKVLGVSIPQQIRLARRRPGARPLNDVVLIYYQGIEHVDTAGRLYFLSSYSLDAKADPDRPPPYSIKDSDLASIFTETLGAHVLLRDSRRPNSTAEVRWPDGARFGTLCLAWLGQEGPKASAEVLLLSELAKTPLTGTLKDLKSRLEATFKPLTSGRYRKQLVYEPNVPAVLDSLAVGPAP